MYRPTMKRRNRARVLYLQPAPLFGGAERQAATSASLLPRCGVEVVPVVGPGQAILDWLRERGVEQLVHTPHFPGGWRKQRGILRLTLPFRYFRCGARLRRALRTIVREYDISVIVASLPFAWFVGFLVARWARIPIVWRAGGARINFVQAAALWLVTRFVRPDLLLCTSESVRRTFSPLVPAAVHVVPNGVDTEVFRPGAGDASRYRPPHASLVVGYAARLARGKRPRDFVELAARLRDEFPDVRFVLGGEGSMRRELEAYAKRLGADNLVFAGFITDMPSFYASCDVLALPSETEGCPNFVLEAMAMGKPLVAADVAPVLELVERGKNGLVYPVGNIAALAEQTALLLRDGELRATLGQNARLRALEFTAERNAARIAASLKLLSREGRKRRFRALSMPIRSPLPPAPVLPPAPELSMPSPSILASDLRDSGSARSSEPMPSARRTTGSGGQA